MCESSSSPTVREYDHNMRERIAELERGLSIIARLADNVDFVSEFDSFRAQLNKCCDRLREVVAQYDMIAVSFLPYGLDKDGARFKLALLCANIDARFNSICREVHDMIMRIQEIFGLCAEIENFRGRRPRIISRNTQTQDISREQSELKIITRTALGHISRAESCDYVIAKGCLRKTGSTLCTDCGAKMRLMLEASEAVCDNCGRVITIDGNNSVSLRAMGSFYTSNNTARNRRSGYNFVRHLKIWLDRLQAIESDEFNASDIARIRASIVSEYISAKDVPWRTLSCDDLVRHLSLCGLSYLGEHLPKLLKELGGRAPPILDYDSEQIILRDFAHIMEIYATIFQGPGNKPYYPFFISKIVRRRFARGCDVRRLLDYIMKQGRDTINRHDKIYKRICDSAPSEYDLLYEPEKV